MYFMEKNVHIIQFDPSHIISNSSLKVLNGSFRNLKEKKGTVFEQT